MIKQIPNIITLCNLICGCLSITYAANAQLEIAAWLVIAATVFDFFDGFVARSLKADGAMGKQLDSLCDVVSFGVAPGFIWYQMMQQYGMCSADGFCINKYIWLALPLGAAYRLAKFNIDERQTSGFLGMPTPITGILHAGIAIAIAHHSFAEKYYINFYVLLLLPILTAYLAISELPILALKFKKNDAQGKFKIAFLLLSLVSIFILQWDSFAFIYIILLFISVIANFATNKTQTT